MDEHPPTVLGKVFIFLLTVAVGLLIVAGLVLGLFSACIEVAKPLVESGK